MMQIKEILSQHGYTLLEQIGKGGYSTCYKVLSHKYQNVFACKVINLEYNYKNEEKIESFSAEIDALQHARHPNVINIYDFFSSDSVFFLVLEFCPGGNLEELIKREGPLGGRKLNDVLGQIVAALSYCHARKITHHDIKPSNVFVETSGRVKLADFGLSKINETQEAKEYFGSYAYAAPELYLKMPNDPYKTDVWAFGVTMYELAVGSYPFQASTPKEMFELVSECKYSFPESVEPNVKAIIQKCLIPDPEQRATMQQIESILLVAKENPISKSPITRKMGRALTSSTCRIVLRNSFVSKGTASFMAKKAKNIC